MIKEKKVDLGIAGPKKDIDKLTKDKLYGMSKKLFEEKQGLENYLSKKTNDLFDL